MRLTEARGQLGPFAVPVRRPGERKLGRPQEQWRGKERAFSGPNLSPEEFRARNKKAWYARRNEPTNIGVQLGLPRPFNSKQKLCGFEYDPRHDPGGLVLAVASALGLPQWRVQTGGGGFSCLVWGSADAKHVDVGKALGLAPKALEFQADGVFEMPPSLHHSGNLYQRLTEHELLEDLQDATEFLQQLPVPSVAPEPAKPPPTRSSEKPTAPTAPTAPATDHHWALDDPIHKLPDRNFHRLLWALGLEAGSNISWFNKGGKEEHPSMNVGKKGFKCYATEVQGSLVDLVMHKYKLSFGQALVATYGLAGLSQDALMERLLFWNACGQLQPVYASPAVERQASIPSQWRLDRRRVAEFIRLVDGLYRAVGLQMPNIKAACRFVGRWLRMCHMAVWRALRWLRDEGWLLFDEELEPCHYPRGTFCYRIRTLVMPSAEAYARVSRPSVIPHTQHTQHTQHLGACNRPLAQGIVEFELGEPAGLAHGPP